ncbi:MAG: 50S ribosomal protein L13 [Chloroflexi bacterium]|jgi:large subunit ribosomal protein L13|nr:50S ribosomal protein L13 [Chloroflexota bacterium]MBK9748627.1 50S ribosomal protein L13 [Chloroflexota bacterium]
MLVKTYSPKPQDIQRTWYVVDADGQTLGRLASRIAHILRGKHKAIFAPHIDTGDFVIVINAEKIRVTGDRLDSKVYYRHSKYQGGLKAITLRDQLAKFPDRPIMDAVKGMLPKGALGHQMIKKLKVYKGSTHPHEAQKPVELKLDL